MVGQKGGRLPVPLDATVNEKLAGVLLVDPIGGRDVQCPAEEPDRGAVAPYGFLRVTLDVDGVVAELLRQDMYVHNKSRAGTVHDFPLSHHWGSNPTPPTYHADALTD